MRPKLIIIYLLIVLVPLVAVAYLGVTLARNEQAVIAMQFRQLLTGKLNDVRDGIARLLDQHERELMGQRGLSTLSSDELRQRTQVSGIVRQFFVIDAQGNLLYPAPDSELTSTEREFLDRTRSIWINGEIPAYSAESQFSNVSAAKGWHAAYWGSGLRLIFWWHDEAGKTVGAELNEMRLAADIIGLLPAAWPEMPADQSALPDGRITLADSTGAIFYQWGGYISNENEPPQVQQPLLPPLNSWTLSYYAPSRAIPTGFGRSILFNVLSGIAVLCIAMSGLALYFYGENTRAMREALQRVTFVNQVSHELKTPLTNIRLYAEMLDANMAKEDEDTSGAHERRHHLAVIVSECQRLSRLINNVLTFSRSQRGMIKPHKAAGNIDESLQAVLQRFEPALQRQGARLNFTAGASLACRFDHDALEQIVGNLLSNVEKYAASGGVVDVKSCQTDDIVTITVADKGPGIPPHLRDRIFEPFFRVSDKLTEGVAGAGIGLTIARQLASLHGGDLTVEPAEEGSCFKLVLRAERITSGDAI